MLKLRVSLTTKSRGPERLFWARQHLLRFHLIQNKRMLGLNFNHLGNGFSYLGCGTRRLRNVVRTRCALAFPNRAQLVNPLRALSSTLKGQVELDVHKEVYLYGYYFFSSSTLENLANKDFNADLFHTNTGAVVPFVASFAEPSVAPSTAQLSLFVRLSLLRDLSFYLFLNSNVKLKFVLSDFVPQPLLDALFKRFPLLRLEPSYQPLKSQCATKVAATTPGVL